MRQRLKVFATILGIAVLCIASTRASAQRAADDRFDPKPAAGDMVLPMPGGLNMVFRRLAVPGKGYWGDVSRSIHVGAPEDIMFEALQRRQIGGSFPGRGDTWEIVLGKYEVSKAQFIAVLGQGDQAAGLAAYLEASGNPDEPLRNTGLSREKREREMMKPVAWTSWSSIQRFLEAYTAWCYETPACLRAMPRLYGQSGFFRLPTEIEWEYAARGGPDTLAHTPGAQPLFNEVLPFSTSRIKDFAHVGGQEVLRIGRKDPLNGLHDMFGNVGELTSGQFFSEFSEGKPGGLIARGGSYSTAPEDLRSSLRTEIPYARLSAAAGGRVTAGDPLTGFRLAIGSLSIPPESQRAALEQAYAAYRAGIRPAVPTGTIVLGPLVQAREPLDDIEKLAAQIAGHAPSAKMATDRILKRVNEVRQNVQFNDRKQARWGVRQALSFAIITGRDMFRLVNVERSIELLRPLASRTTSYQRTLRDEEQTRDRLAEGVDAYFVEYLEAIAALADTADPKSAIEELYRSNLRRDERAAMDLIINHLSTYLTTGQSLPSWKNDVRQTFADGKYWNQ